MMHSGTSTFHRFHFLLTVALVVFIMQGCVIHSHNSYPSNRYKTKSYTGKVHSHHGVTYSRNTNKPVGYAVKVPPPRNNSSNFQNPPPHARAHEVAKGKPFANKEQHPSHTEGPPQHARAHQVAKGKPFKNESHQSSNGNSHKANKANSNKKSNHPSFKKHGIHEHNKNKKQPLWATESTREKSGTSKNYLNGRSSGNSKKFKETPGKGKAKERAKEVIVNSSDQDSIIEESLNSPNEKFQIAKAEPIQSSRNSKEISTEGNVKLEKNKPQKNKNAPASPQAVTPGKASSQPVATTASLTPLTFDSDQRATIQSFYRKPGKSKGKRNKKPKGRSAFLMTKNDILTKSFKPLPKKLKSQLPPPPPNTRRVLFNLQVLLLERNTNRVLDVINLNN